MQKKKIMFIFNPVSGALKHYNIPIEINKYIDHKKFEVHISESQYAGHTKVIAHDAAIAGFDIVCAIGGDGSINEVVNGIIGTSAKLAVIPMGSGNGFANHLQIPPRNFKECINIINHGKVEKIDLVKSANTYFVSVGGMGFEALAAKLFKEHPLRGFLSYFIAVIRQYFGFKSTVKVKVHIDNKAVMNREVFILSVFNSNQYGYNIGFTNNSSMKDGVLEMVMVKRFSPLRLPWNVFILMMRKPHWSSDVEYYKGYKIRVEKIDGLVVQHDGDPFVWNEELNMEVAPAAIEVMLKRRLEKF